MPPSAEGIASRIFVGPALRAQSDRRLVTLVRDGYEAAFEEIVRRYGAALGRYARAIVGGHAEDVTQDAFSKALLALRRDGAEIELRPWLYRIVCNTALNDLRDRPPAAQELTEPLAHTGSVSEEVERREEVAELARRLRQLPQPQRAAIVMRELEGLSHEEIAAALGVTGGAARQTIHRARTALRDAVGAAIPLPLLRVLIDHGAEASAAGAGAGGAAAAASVGSAGAGGVLKAGLATALIAGSVGTGLVVHRDRHELDAGAARAATVPSARASDDSVGGSLARRGESGFSGTEDHRGSGNDDPDDRGRGGSEPGDDSSRGEGSGPGSSGSSEHSGTGRDGSGDGGEPSSNSGPGSGSDRDLSGGDGSLSEHSGSGGSGSGEESLSGSGSSSGPGSGETTLPDGGSSGPGSGDLSSGSGGGGSSGPGDGSFSSGTSGSGSDAGL
jgi:RNA polymerase sigma factor (sigma-70 family)